MGKEGASDRRDSMSNRPRTVIVEVSVLRDAEARTFHERIAGITTRTCRRVIALLALGVAITAGATVWQLAGPRAERQLVSPVARERGPTGVAAAYGYPLRCLSITILDSDRTYARADFNHQSPCGRYTGSPTAILHYSSGAWRTVLDAVAYFCPVKSLPPEVQTQLEVCLGGR